MNKQKRGEVHGVAGGWRLSGVCRWLFCLAVLALSGACVAAPSGTDEPDDNPWPPGRIRSLYACHFYFEAGSHARDAVVAGKYREYAGMFLLNASIGAVKTGGEAAAKVFAGQGLNIYRDVDARLRSTAAADERSQLQRGFVEDCGKLVNTVIDLPVTPAVAVKPAPQDRLVRSRGLYACFSFFSTGAKGAAPGAYQDKLRRIAGQFLVLATRQAVAADSDPDPVNVAMSRQLAEQGQADLKAVMAEVDKLPTKEQQNARMEAFVKDCMARTEAEK